MRKVETLIPYARNARTHSDQQVAQIAASIKEFGFNNPILIRDDLTVIAGHGRLAAATKLGLTEVPTICLSHLTPTQVKAYILADNKLAMNAGWDEEMLALEMQELKSEGFAIDLIGFDESEIDKLLTENTVEGNTDEDDVPETSDNVVSRDGDVWLLGRHRVMCGDSCDAGKIADLLENQKADLWITDPPYNVSYQGGTKEKLTIKNDTMEDSDFRLFLRSAYSAADCAITRAGAGTIAELASCRTPSILIPYPLAADDHQSANAQAVAALGAAELLAESSINQLSEKVFGILNDNIRLAGMRDALAMMDASNRWDEMYVETLQLAAAFAAKNV